MLAADAADENNPGKQAYDNLEKFWRMIEPYAVALLKVIIIVVISHKLIKMLTKLIRHATSKAGLERGVASFLASLINIVLYAMVAIIIAGIVGIPTASLIAVLSSIGVAISLALQGSLSNFAGGVLILVMKPFLVGDYISASGYEGTVTEIDICYTRVKTVDNRIVVLPNGSLANSNLVNWSRESERMVDTTLPVAYETDIDALRTLLFRLAEEDPLVLKTRELKLYVKNFGDSSIELSFRVWVKTKDYWPVRFGMPEKIKKAMEENGFVIPFNQMDVLIKNMPEGTEIKK
jgi:small conductance mechanosensitive channel